MEKQERDKFRDRLLVTDRKYNGEEYNKRLQEHVTRSTMKNFSGTPKIKRPNQNKKRKKFIPVKIGALMLATIAGISGITYGFAKSIIPEEKRTLNEAIASGKTLETLGINEDIQGKLANLQEKMISKNLTNEEIIQMAPQINDLCFDISTTKLSNVLGVRQENISFEENNEDGVNKPRIKVNTGYSKEIYNEQNIFNKNTFPKEISNEIKDMKTIQKIIQEVQNGNFNRDDVLDKYATILRDTENLAAAAFKKEGGNIVVVDERDSTKKGEQNLTEKQSDIGATRDEGR